VHIASVSVSDCGRGATCRETALPETDGIVTAEEGVPIGVLVADCVPVALFDPVRRVGAVVHAGREGTMQDIAGKAVSFMSEAHRCKPGDIHAIIGPSAGPCCYEVSPEIADEFESAGLPRQGRMLDLWAANRMQLVRAGMSPDKINVTKVCTICSDRLHSYRADGSRRRNMMLLMI
jgi:YfiH family protein